ncbi:MAG: hypothetical protein AAGF85_00575 [Bacteroidota bacterium]
MKHFKADSRNVSPLPLGAAISVYASHNCGSAAGGLAIYNSNSLQNAEPQRFRRRDDDARPQPSGRLHRNPWPGRPHEKRHDAPVPGGGA